MLLIYLLYICYDGIITVFFMTSSSLLILYIKVVIKICFIYIRPPAISFLS